ncbi:MAG: polysaccharide deacetylase family protein [Deltaproteobacteria bacterium]|nr:polysaccharide deacetylase family protein [Deltaproteobacteria bacterium]MBW2306968.1 polysaccharide deacetylase family protein [Deltaproteobacteria bacterium]
MPWKNGYTITDEKSMEDESVEWPDNNQCAVGVVVDYSVPAGSDGIGPKDVQNNQAEFGARVGIWRLFDLFAKYKIKATFAVPAVVAEIYPESAEEIVKRGHEVAAHGYRHEDVTELDIKEEKTRLDATTQILADICGKKPEGWFSLPRQMDRYASGTVSPDTMNLLIDAGYEYMGNGMADDIPHYWVTDFHTRRNILTLPYYYHFDDQFFLMFPPVGMGSGLENPMTLFQNWKQEFDAQYKRGRYFSMTVHPFLIGWGNRLEILEKMIIHLTSFPAVWNPTGSECAAYWKTRYPASSYLKLNESIWKDYPGSLS